MSRESIREEPVLDEDIIEQNLELMEERFPEVLLEEWNTNVLPIVETVISQYTVLGNSELGSMCHKCAGSALQLGANQLGQSLRTVSHMIRAGNRESALSILEDIPMYLELFNRAVAETK